MTRVLAFGDNRSAEANKCWHWIISHRWDGWSLEVVTAEPPADLHPVDAEDAVLHPWAPEDPRQPDDSEFVSVEHLRAEIDPRLALISRPWDLVAIGPRGSGILKRLHLGSTADWLLREPTSPLLIARQPEPVRRILVASDGSPHAQRAIETLASFPWLDGVSVHVIAVDEGRPDVDLALDQAVAIISTTSAEVISATLEGSPTEVIVGEIEAVKPDLVVLGARGHNRFERLLIGSTTAEVAGSTDRSILVAHADGERAG